MKFEDSFTIAVAAGEPLVRVDTDEPEYTVQCVRGVCQNRGWDFLTWDIVHGVRDADDAPNELTLAVQPGVGAPFKAVGAALLANLADEKTQREQPRIVCLRNAQLIFASGAEYVVGLFEKLAKLGQERLVTLVLPALPTTKLPPEIAALCWNMSQPLPTAAELTALFDEKFVDKFPALPAAERAAVVDAVAGLTRRAAVTAAATSLAAKRDRFDPAFMWERKVEAVNRDGLLKIHQKSPPLDSIGGNDGAKSLLSALLRNSGREPHLRAKGFLIFGPPGCLHPDTPITDPVDGTTKTVYARWKEEKSFHVLALNEAQEVIIALAERPWRYPAADMLEVTFANGLSIKITDEHRFKTCDGWLSAREVAEQLRVSERVLLPTIADICREVRNEDVRRSKRTTTEVVKVVRVQKEAYYDFHVPKFQNYFAQGVFHHNTGKTMLAQAIGHACGWRAVNVDPGRLKGEFVGTTERQTRQMFDVLASLSPVLGIVDEVGKVMPRYSDARDGGVGNAMLGAFLSHMSDDDSDTVWAFTANADALDLHEAFTRAGRVDLKIFVDLPSAAARSTIWAMYLKRYFPELSLDKLTAANAVAHNKVHGEKRDTGFSDEGWTGAEIQACCRLAAIMKYPLEKAARLISPVHLSGGDNLTKMRGFAADIGAIDAETGEPVRRVKLPGGRRTTSAD